MNEVDLLSPEVIELTEAKVYSFSDNKLMFEVTIPDVNFPKKGMWYKVDIDRVTGIIQEIVTFFDGNKTRSGLVFYGECKKIDAKQRKF